MADLDLRKVRYFVAVAEHLHFGRAAAELHIAQPVLSRQIRALEDELKVRLFERDRRSTALTPAGEQLLADARPLLAGAEALRRRVTAAARGTPADQRGLAVRPLLTEPRVVVLPADHRLAGKESVAITDLADEHLLQDPDVVPEWRDVAAELRTGAREPEPVFRSVEEKLEHVAAGRGVVVLPRSTATFYTRSDIVSVAVRGLGPNHVCLAWDPAHRSPLVQEFVAIAEARTDEHMAVSR